jgi:polysaccharide export outer membrane protein
LNFELETSNPVVTMKRDSWKTILLLVVWLAATPVWAAEATPGTASGQQSVMVPSPTGAAYLIGPGDVLGISVWEVAALTKSVTVLPDGRVAFPLIGELQAKGRTIAQLKEEIEKKITRYVPAPVVSVEVSQVNSMLIYVIGRVNGPGRYVLNANVKVLQALAMAGGLNPFAKRSKIKIFRGSPSDTQTFEFDYDEVSDGENLEQNIVLERGDVIVVP